jgi:phytoene synthase
VASPGDAHDGAHEAGVVSADGKTREGLRVARAALRVGSKSFALAGRLLPRECRDDAAVLYAWCRRADDLIDLAPPNAHAGALAQLEAELDLVELGVANPDPLLAAFTEVVHRRAIPLEYARELVAGMRMDAEGVRYLTLSDLMVYCFRVAGTVGLMMSHVLGVRSAAALGPAVDLGMAMQLTNICRDVVEDRGRDRVYLPASLLAAGTVEDQRRVIAALLEEAERLYRSGDGGMAALPWRAAIGVRAARLVYSAIGDEITSGRCDPLVARAVVSRTRKRWLVVRALWDTVRARVARRFGRGRRLAAPSFQPLPLFPSPRSANDLSVG